MNTIRIGDIYKFNASDNKFHQKYTDKSHCTPKLYEKFKIILQNEMTMSKLRINN